MFILSAFYPKKRGRDRLGHYLFSNVQQKQSKLYSGKLLKIRKLLAGTAMFMGFE